MSAMEQHPQEQSFWRSPTGIICLAFLAIGGADVFAGDEGFGFTEDRLIDRLIKRDANFAAAGGPEGRSHSHIFAYVK